MFGIREQWDDDDINDLADSYGQQWVGVGCYVAQSLLL